MILEIFYSPSLCFFLFLAFSYVSGEQLRLLSHSMIHVFNAFLMRSRRVRGRGRDTRIWVITQ